MQVRPRLGKHRSAVTPTRDRKTPITAAARWINDRGSAATGQRDRGLLADL